METEVNAELITGFRYNSRLRQVGEFVFQKNTTKRLRNGDVVSYYICNGEKECPVKLYDRNGRFYMTSNDHCHEPDLYKHTKNKMMNEIKQKLRENPLSSKIRSVFDEISMKPE